MVLAFYSAYALIYLGLSIFAFLTWRRTRWLSSLFILGSLIGLLYDNGVLSLGGLFGEGETLRALTVGRYCLHFAFTPLLLWTLLEQARRLGHRWAGTGLARGLTGVLIAAMIVYGFVTEVNGLELAFVLRDGISRYEAVDFMLASVVVPIGGAAFALIVGLLLWRKNGWPWLFLATLTAFLSIGAAEGTGIPVLQLVENLGEILYLAAYLFTERHVFGLSGKDRA